MALVVASCLVACGWIVGDLKDVPCLGAACGDDAARDAIGDVGAGDDGAVDAGTGDGSTCRTAVPCIDGVCVLLARDGGGPSDLALDDAGFIYVAFESAGEIWSVSTAGEDAGLVAAATGARNIAVDDSHLVWGSSSGGFTVHIVDKAKPDAAPREGQPTDNAPRVWLTPDVLYYANGSTIYRYSFAGGSQGFDSGTDITDLAVAGDRIFYLNRGAVGSIRSIGTDWTSLRAVSVPNVSDRDRVAVNATHVYFTSLDGGVSRLPLSFDNDASPETVGAVGDLDGIALDSKFVYAVHNFHRLSRIALDQVGAIPEKLGECRLAEEVRVDDCGIYVVCHDDGTLLKFLKR